MKKLLPVLRERDVAVPKSAADVKELLSKGKRTGSELYALKLLAEFFGQVGAICCG